MTAGELRDLLAPLMDETEIVSPWLNEVAVVYDPATDDRPARLIIGFAAQAKRAA